MNENVHKNLILERINDGNLYFSILSMITSISILSLLILRKKELVSLTFTFLKYIFISEILNSIGNIIQSTDTYYEYYNKKSYSFLVYFSLSLISFSDMLTNILFLWFSYCSVKCLKESKREIKDSVNKYVIISFIISFVYFLFFIIVNSATNDKFVDIRFKFYYYRNDKNKYREIYGPQFYIFSFFHTLFIMLISFVSLKYIYEVNSFLWEKQKNDNVNSRKIVKLIKILMNFGLICLFYWVFLIPRILFVDVCEEDNTLRDIIYLLSDAFFCSRGFLLFLNSLMISKIQTIINKFIEVNIKHYLLLNFGSSSKKSKSKKDSQYEKLLN
jgi:hypothetical protein